MGPVGRGLEIAAARAGIPPAGALHNRAAHVPAIGDIVEPVEAWRTLKYEKMRRDWDYVFRRLFYTWTADIRQTPFSTPVEIDTVEETCGYILNLDLYVDGSGGRPSALPEAPVPHVLHEHGPRRLNAVRCH